MNIKEVRQIAKARAVKSARLSKAELIRNIQRAEDNFDCYGSNYDGTCDQTECSWREDCLVESNKISASA